MKVICECCGIEFDKPLAEVKRTKHNFCSIDCFKEKRRQQRPVVVCDYCGKEFNKKPGDITEHNYCCRDCQLKDIGRLNLGSVRSEETKVKISESHIGDKNPAYRDGRSYYKLRGKKVHIQIAEEMLGRPLLPDEVVHHIDLDRHNNDPSNLMVMTRSEHARLHQELRKNAVRT